MGKGMNASPPDMMPAGNCAHSMVLIAVLLRGFKFYCYDVIRWVKIIPG
jgi:hypothetical protein